MIFDILLVGLSVSTSVYGSAIPSLRSDDIVPTHSRFRRAAFTLQNGQDAIALNNKFKGFTAATACNAGENGCVGDQFAQCVAGKFAVTGCAGGLVCRALPLVNSAGTSITCDTAADADARIANTGATSGGSAAPAPIVAAPSSSAPPVVVSTTATALPVVTSAASVTGSATVSTSVAAPLFSSLDASVAAPAPTGTSVADPTAPEEGGDDPEQDDPEQDDPAQGNPEQDDPEQDDPEQDEPEQEDPDQGEATESESVVSATATATSLVASATPPVIVGAPIVASLASSSVLASATATAAPVASVTSSSAAPTIVATNESQFFSGGQASFFEQGGAAGACGQVHQDTDNIVAIQAERFGNTPGSSPTCGKQVQIFNIANGKSVTATVADKCPGCQAKPGGNVENSLDLSVGAFQDIASLDDGIVQIKWKFV